MPVAQHEPIASVPGGTKLLASASRTVATVSDDLSLPVGTGGIIVDIDVTSDPAAASHTFTVQGKDPASGAYYTLIASAAIAAVGHTRLTVHPALTTVTANVSVATLVPEIIRVSVAVADTDALVWSVGVTATP